VEARGLGMSYIISKSTDCHWCGDGHSNQCYVVYDTGAYCFSCGKGDRKPAGSYAFKPLESNNNQEIWLPEHTENIKEFSLNVLNWLYKYYIYQETIKQYRLAYCPPQAGKTESLLLPILDGNGQVIEYQRRFSPNKTFYSTKGLKHCLYQTGNHTTDIVILVEDPYSAIRVGKYFNCICLFGTLMSQIVISYVTKNYSHVLFWLDPDEAGQKSAKKEIDRLYNIYLRELGSRLFSRNENITINNIVSKKQPKELPDSEIRGIINEKIL
jgi:hypothetical protein